MLEGREFVPTGLSKKIPRSALTRIMILLSVIMLLVIGWEYQQSSKLQAAKGKVIKITKVFARRGGDKREFQIEYFVNEKRYILVTRRSIIDSVGAFCCLSPGTSVPIAWYRDTPFKAILDSFSARYPMSISFGMLTLVVILFLLFFVIRARYRRLQSS